MYLGYSRQFDAATVVIEPGENPSIEAIIDFAHHVGAIKRYEKSDVDVDVTDIVIDDQSGHVDTGIGPEIYEQDTLTAMIDSGQTTWHALVS